jgi:ATP-dependent Clp protease protease subunit
MSAACALLSCGDEGLRFCAPNVTLMVHEVSSFSAGKTIDIQSDARETARLNQSVLSVMDRGCGHPPGYFSQLIHSKGHADVFLSAKQALKHNLCNVIGLPHLALQVTAEYAFGVPAVPKPHKHSAACKHGGPKSGKAAK